MFSLNIILISSVLLIFYSKISNQHETKIWIPNSNFNNKNNWLKHQLPCESSKIIFPQDLNAAVYLPSSVTVQIIDLPNDGDLVFKQDGALEITNQEEVFENCDRKEVTFKKINLEPWLKPSNWKLLTNKPINFAIPHSEQVPCVYDNVIFPNESTYWVQYPEISISVNQLSIEGEDFSDNRLQDFLLSEPGNRQFQNLYYQERLSIINVKNLECQDPSGCSCHEDNFVDTAVCKNLQQVCSIPHCLKPVKPIGHCCEFCGATILVHFEQHSFNLNKFREILNNYKIIFGYQNVDLHASKVWTKFGNRIQIVFVEKDFKYNGDSISLAENIHKDFISDLKKYKLLASDLTISGSEYYPGQQLHSSLATVFGTLLTVLLIFVIIYIIYGPAQDKKWGLPFNLPNLNSFRPFIFVRFENSGDADGSLEFRNRSVASSLFNLDRAFENPMFQDEPPGPSNDGETNSEPEDKEEREDKETQQMEFKNLMFSELQKNDLSDEE